MKLIRTALGVMITGVSLFLLGCTPSSSGAAIKTQETIVKKGDIRIDVTASGNLAYSEKEGLSFEMAGTVSEVLVEAGDSVRRGQELVKMDTDAWEDKLDALKDQVTVAGRQVPVRERELARAERQVAAKELAARQAQLDLQTAEYNVSQIAEVKAAQNTIDGLESQLKILQQVSAVEGSTVRYDPVQVAALNGNLAQAKKHLQEVLSGTSTKVTGDVTIAVAKSQLQVEQSRKALEEAFVAVEDAKVAVADARATLDTAKDTLAKAEENLKEALAYKTVITAPFSGIVTKVSVLEGAEIRKDAILVEVADPVRFEAEVMVSEMDIFQIREGGQATVQPTAAAGTSLPAKVARISPTATVQQGVVNYKVKVEVQLQNTTPARAVQSQNATIPQGAAGQLPEQVRAAIAEGRITQEQVNEMIRRRQEGASAFGQAGPPGPGQRALTGASSNTSSRQPTTSSNVSSRQPTTGQPGTQRQFGQETTGGGSSTFQLREGLTVTVNIVITEKTGVLLVPNRAITRQAGKTTVKVTKEGQVETRAVVVGINDFQNTEILEGLSEGEKLVITPTSTPASSGTQNRPGQTPAPRIFPGGGMIR